MIVRCGRCRTELDVAGAGEFLCPACGTRNVVRSQPSAGGGLYGPGGVTLGGTSPTPRTEQDDTPVRWVLCPSCAYRFVAGEGVDEVICPNCRTGLTLSESGAQPRA